MKADINITLDNGDQLLIKNAAEELKAGVRQRGSSVIESRYFPPALLHEVVKAFTGGVGIHSAGAPACLAYLDYVRDMNEHPVEEKGVGHVVSNMCGGYADGSTY